MSRIFSWEEISDWYVPSSGDFVDVCTFTKKVVKESDAFLGGVIIGSTAHGTATARSDIDLVTVCKKYQQCEAESVLRRISAYAHARYIPLEPITLDDEIARTELHDVDATLVEHIKMAEKSSGYIKQRISHFINAKVGTKEQTLFGTSVVRWQSSLKCK